MTTFEADGVTLHRVREYVWETPPEDAYERLTAHKRENETVSDRFLVSAH